MQFARNLCRANVLISKQRSGIYSSLEWRIGIHTHHFLKILKLLPLLILVSSNVLEFSMDCRNVCILMWNRCPWQSSILKWSRVLIVTQKYLYSDVRLISLNVIEGSMWCRNFCVLMRGWCLWQFSIRKCSWIFSVIQKSLCSNMKLIIFGSLVSSDVQCNAELFVFWF